MQIGDYKVTAINSGYFKLDGGAMYGIIPRPLWEKANPPDSLNRIKMITRNLLLQGNGRKILIDPQWIIRVSWEESKVFVDLTKESIKNSPEFDPFKQLTPITDAPKTLHISGKQ